MSSKQRRRFGAEKKALIVRRHLAEKVPVSDLADEFGVQPSQIHTWVKQVLDQAEKASERVLPRASERERSRSTIPPWVCWLSYARRLRTGSLSWA